jgi:hypothetical protein
MDLRFHALALLPKDAPIELDELARLLCCHPATIKRNEKQGRIPRSYTGVSGKRTWIVGKILAYWQMLADKASAEGARLNRIREGN